MFFRKMTDSERYNNSKVIELVFIFYLIALSIHAVYGYMVMHALNASFYILILGLFLFFVAGCFFNKKTISIKG